MRALSQRWMHSAGWQRQRRVRGCGHGAAEERAAGSCVKAEAGHAKRTQVVAVVASTPCDGYFGDAQCLVLNAGDVQAVAANRAVLLRARQRNRTVSDMSSCFHDSHSDKPAHSLPAARR